MKSLLCLFCCVAWVQAAPSEAEVAQLKRDFPKHIAPGSVEKMHPVARECWQQFQAQADRLQADLLSKQAVDLAQSISSARSTNQMRSTDAAFALGHAGREAARLNVRWIEQKLLPWAKRVAAAARK